MTELRFDDEVVLITGAAGGIGSAYARLLAARGADLVLHDMPETSGTQKQLTSELVELGAEVSWVSGDVVDGAPELVEQAMEQHGHIDLVIANAGASSVGGAIGDSDMDAFDRTVDVNYRSTYMFMHYAWPHLVSSGGRAVLTSSASVFGIRSAAAYTSSKAAVMTLAKTFGMDGEPHGVR